MEQHYAECNVKRATTPAVIFAKVVFILCVIAIIMLSLIIRKGFLILICVAAIVALVWYWPRFKVVWEYVYCDGQIDFDQILGGENRRNVEKVDMDNADILAPWDSHEMDMYREMRVKNYSSMSKESKPYAVVVRDKNNNQVVILWEPNQKMLDMIADKYPSKSKWGTYIKIK